MSEMPSPPPSNPDSGDDVIDPSGATPALPIWRDVFEAVPDAVVVISADGVVALFNRQAETLFGYARDEVIGRPLEMLLPERLHGSHREHRTAYVQAPQARPMGTGLDLLGRRKSGEEFAAEVSLSPMQGPSGLMVVSSVRDISDRRAAEGELRQSEAIVSSSADMVALVSSDFVYLAANDAYVAAFGKDRDKIVGRSVVELLGREMFTAVIEPHARRCLAGESVRHEQWVELPVAGRQFLEVNYSPFRGSDDTIQGFVVNARNATVEHELEEQLRQAQKLDAIGKLAGGVAHDFNNQLSGVLGFAELAMQKLPPTHPAVEDILLVRKAGQKAAEMTHYLLAFSRKQVLRPEIVDMDELLASTEALLGRLIGEHIELAFIRGRGRRRIKVDPLQFEQAIVNLATNARDAMPNGGRLTFETSEVELDADNVSRIPQVEPGPYVLLVVRDSGQGMDADTLAAAFEPFFTTKVIGKGTGLGLSMVHGFVRQSGGHIWGHSEPGQGTTFELHFPRVDDLPSRVTRPAIRPSVPGGSETILLVEDEEIVREVSRRGLESHGYTVIVAEDGDEALRLASAHAGEIHLLLTDVVMPGLGGRQVAELLLVTRPDTKVLYSSGYAEDAIVHHGVLDPGTHFLAKPITPDSLARKVREVLDGGGG